MNYVNCRTKYKPHVYKASELCCTCLYFVLSLFVKKGGRKYPNLYLKCYSINKTSVVIFICSVSIYREDAEAPKAKLVKPNSLSSSRSGSSRSGASSTQSMVHNCTQRGHRPRPPAIAALKENGQPPGFPQSPPSYNSVAAPKTPEPPTTPKFNSRNMSGPTPPTLMVPAQTKAFQTV